jgi:hypothetical protein
MQTKLNEKCCRSRRVHRDTEGPMADGDSWRLAGEVLAFICVQTDIRLGLDPNETQIKSIR